MTDELSAEGIPEKEPETIGDALKRYYEEQLTNGNKDMKVVQLPPRMAELEKIMTQHCMAFN